jgi:hypothetical protein
MQSLNRRADIAVQAVVSKARYAPQKGMVAEDSAR